MARQAAAASAWAFWRTTASLVASLVLEVRPEFVLAQAFGQLDAKVHALRALARRDLVGFQLLDIAGALDQALLEFRVQVEDALDRLLVDHQHGHVGQGAGGVGLDAARRAAGQGSHLAEQRAPAAARQGNRIAGDGRPDQLDSAAFQEIEARVVVALVEDGGFRADALDAHLRQHVGEFLRRVVGPAEQGAQPLADLDQTDIALEVLIDDPAFADQQPRPVGAQADQGHRRFRPRPDTATSFPPAGRSGRWWRRLRSGRR